MTPPYGHPCSPSTVRLRRLTRIHRGELVHSHTFFLCNSFHMLSDPAVRPQREYGSLALLHMRNNVRYNGYGGTVHRRQYGV
jgi:hypothetical protein